MKGFLIAVSICGSLTLAMGEPRDPYQQVPPDLVRNVDLAKAKQNSSDPRQRDEAQSLLQAVINRKPDYYRALYNLGLIYLEKNEADKAVDVLTKAKAVRDKDNLPDYDSAILNSLGWAYLNAGDLKKAEVNLKLAYDRKDQNEPLTNERVLNNLGYLYLQEGKTTEARKFLDESKNRYHSSRADSILNLVNEYERQQNKTHPTGQTWAVYGQQIRANRTWDERHFDVQGGNTTSVPKPNDTVIAFDNVYLRSSVPVWDDATQDYVLGPIIGYIKPGERVLVLEVLNNNPPTDENAWYWIRLSRLPKK